MVALATQLPILATFAVTAVVYGIVQYSASLWLIDHWDAWIESKDGRRFEARLQKWRQGRVTSRLIAGLTGGSMLGYFVACLAFATVNIVGIWKLSTDEPMARWRIAFSAAVYATWCAALWTAAGYGILSGVTR